MPKMAGRRIAATGDAADPAAGWRRKTLADSRRVRRPIPGSGSPRSAPDETARRPQRTSRCAARACCIGVQFHLEQCASSLKCPLRARTAPHRQRAVGRRVQLEPHRGSAIAARRATCPMAGQRAAGKTGPDDHNPSTAGQFCQRICPPGMVEPGVWFVKPDGCTRDRPRDLHAAQRAVNLDQRPAQCPYKKAGPTQRPRYARVHRANPGAGCPQVMPAQVDQKLREHAKRLPETLHAACCRKPRHRSFRTGLPSVRFQGNLPVRTR